MRFSLLELVSIRLESSFTAYALLKERFDGVEIFSPPARSPFGRRPFYPDDPVDPVQLSFND